MSSIVEFTGNAVQHAEAETWCQKLIEAEWASRHMRTGQYAFAFEKHSEAVLFHQRHQTLTSPPEPN
jgi:hypothetical protein